MQKNNSLQPFVKWAGGKRQLLPEIMKHVPERFNTYYEPFVGGGAVLFALQPATAVINDVNAELMNCYQVIRDSPDELIAVLGQHKNEKEYYYQIRDLDLGAAFAGLSPVERAARILYLNHTCFNGLFRVNSHGHFNVPFGRYTNPQIINEPVLRAVHEYLSNNRVELRNTDFVDALRGAGPGDFVYLDPPYDPVSSTASFTAYSSGVSDIHGCADLLSAVLEQAQYKPQNDQIILLGDYIDRGDKSYETVQLAKSLIQGGAIALMGNHEDMAIQAMESDGIEHWFRNGGRNTIRSYTENKAFVEDDIDFLKSLPLYYETDDYIFVHAGLDPEKPRPGSNDSDTLLWIRDDWRYGDYVGKPVIYGHTPARTVARDANGRKIGIDTGAVFWGTLSCLELPGMIVHTTPYRMGENQKQTLVQASGRNAANI